MDKGYHKGQELTMSELGLSLEELAGQPLELFAREGARLLLTVALEEEVTDHVFSLGWRSRRGNRIAKQAWSSIFHHRCYLGETWLKAGDISIKGNHPPLVDEDTFIQVQEVLRGHDKQKQRTQRHKYLLRGLVYSVEAK